MRASMPPRYDVKEVKRVLERAGFEDDSHIYDD